MPCSSHGRSPTPFPGVGVLAALALLGLLSAGCASEAADRAGDDFVAVPVVTAHVERGNLAIFAQYPGELVGEAVELASRIGGRLASVTVRVGDPVKAGQVLATIDERDVRQQLEEARGQLGVTKANLRRQQAQLQETEADFGRARELFDSQLLSEQEFERADARRSAGQAEVGAAEAQVEQAQARARLLEQQLREARVEAPFSGIVAERHLDPGALLQPGSEILRVVQAGSLRVQFRVPELDLGSIDVGDPLTVTTQATGHTTYSGAVRSISGEVSRVDRTVLAEGILTEVVEVLRLGMYAQVRVQLDQIEDGAIVPGRAVLERVDEDGEKRVGIFTTDEGETALWHAVRVLGRDGERVAIDSDVAVGATVLVSGHEELMHGGHIRVVTAGGDGS